METRTYLLRDEHGGPKATWGFARDISYRKRSEARLQAEKEKLNVTLKCIGDAVISTDIHGQVVLMNEAAEKLTGWTAREATGTPVGEVFLCRCNEELCRIVSDVLETGKPVSCDSGCVLAGRYREKKDISSSCLRYGMVPARSLRGACFQRHK